MYSSPSSTSGSPHAKLHFQLGLSPYGGCRVQFDRRELGVELIRDVDVMPSNPTHNLPVSMLQQNPSLVSPLLAACAAQASFQACLQPHGLVRRIIFSAHCFVSPRASLMACPERGLKSSHS